MAFRSFAYLWVDIDNKALSVEPRIRIKRKLTVKSCEL